ncbi:hypothetical protein [Pseudoalteromonas sp. Ps84H-4]|uniref:hypothetical protein n=1 Tax=Pseudoalteromonas sp. Ps84H-4 TaxID=2954502 RepID=UPI00209764BD|nr:hypothetical protein [Pseudoalteromonas sp. Ps84H-4]MCO7251256.1 hypothetical protein [Pseudoalteromonas sp. Ps84H-4]
MKELTLSTKQIISICNFAGIRVQNPIFIGTGAFTSTAEADFLATEHTLTVDKQVQLENGEVYQGLTVHCTEYPEEGYMPLEEVNSPHERT